jgi:hypothetical protein
MRPSSALTFGPGTARRGLAAAACLLALAVAGCNGNAPPPAVYFIPVGPIASPSCPQGQHLITVPAGLPKCVR